MYGPLRLMYSFWLPGLVRGSEHNAMSRAMKPRSGSVSLAVTSWFTWSAWVKWWRGLGRGVVERLHHLARAIPFTPHS